MTQTYAGGCACGAIRYEMRGEPVFQNHCHCLECRRRSGAGHGSYLTFARRAEMTVTGEARTWRVAGDTGAEKVHAFCPTCGTPVYLTFAAAPDAIAIHAGGLDDPDLFRPQAITYGVRAPAWDVMDPALQTFQRMPG